MRRYLRWVPALLILAAMLFLVQFSLDLTVGMLLFSQGLRRRDGFSRRLTVALGLELLAGAAVFYPMVRAEAWVVRTFICYLVLFVLAMAVLAICFEEPLSQLLLCGTSGYMVQHIASQVSQTIWPNGWADVPILTPAWLFWQLLHLAIFAAIYALLYEMFVRKTARLALPPELARSLVGLSVTTLAVVLVVSSVRDAYAGESAILTLASRVLSVFCCLFLLYLRYGILEREILRQERAELVRLNEFQRRQYEQRKEDVALINIKCHDLRRRMELWERQGGRVDPAELRETRGLVDIYDSSVETGNRTLDTLLTQLSLRCQERGIRLSCMVDGHKLGFLPEGDLCAIFGNALENAIEAVSRLEESRRNVSLQARESMDLLVVTVDNPFQGELLFEDGLPKTTKGAEEGWHGFGMKSIRMAAEKYGGEVTVTTDESFHLAVLIPLPH